MTKEQIREEVVNRINEAVERLCSEKHQNGDHVVVFVAFPFHQDMIDCNDVDGIKLADAKLQWEEPEDPRVRACIGFPTLKVTGTII